MITLNQLYVSRCYISISISTVRFYWFSRIPDRYSENSQCPTCYIYSVTFPHKLSSVIVHRISKWTSILQYYNPRHNSCFRSPSRKPKKYILTLSYESVSLATLVESQKCYFFYLSTLYLNNPLKWTAYRLHNLPLDRICKIFDRAKLLILSELDGCPCFRLQ